MRSTSPDNVFSTRISRNFSKIPDKLDTKLFDTPKKIESETTKIATSNETNNNSQSDNFSSKNGQNSFKMNNGIKMNKLMTKNFDVSKKWKLLRNSKSFGKFESIERMENSERSKKSKKSDNSFMRQISITDCDSPKRSSFGNGK